MVLIPAIDQIDFVLKKKIMMKIALWYFTKHINFIVQMYSIVLADYLPSFTYLKSYKVYTFTFL